MRKGGVIAWIAGVSLVAVFSACSDKHKVPSDVLDPEDMEKVMWDMIQADRYAITYLPMDSTKRKDIKTETLKLYDQVFQIHKISRDEFLKSYKFYLSRPDISKVMFDSISTKANRRREDEQKQKMLVETKADSLVNARKKDSLAKLNIDSLSKKKLDSLASRKKADSLLFKKKADSLQLKRKTDSLLTKKKLDSLRKRRIDSLSKNKRRVYDRPRPE